jgi:hypothetical protein
MNFTEIIFAEMNFTEKTFAEIMKLVAEMIFAETSSR